MATDHDDYVLTHPDEYQLSTFYNCEGCGKRTCLAELDEECVCNTCVGQQPRECGWCEYVGPTNTFGPDQSGLTSCRRCGGN